eukprot:m.114569 g.114569  ORF g.114569 m.114569 type:complete len:181 (+) comp14172_c0_seq3:309-851(+)
MTEQLLVDELLLEGPAENGVNVGIAINGHGEYRWEGDVVDGKPHGFGKQTMLKGQFTGYVYYGEYDDGNISGNLIAKHPAANKLWFWDQKHGNLSAFNINNTVHQQTLHMAEEKASLAKALVCVPWSRKTNHFLKWKPKQDFLLTVLLVAERLHRKHAGSSLCTLPVEIWEMILKMAMTT